jgi:hypothetical protein
MVEHRSRCLAPGAHQHEASSALLVTERCRFVEGVGDRRGLEVRKIVLGEWEFLMRLLEQCDKSLGFALVRRFSFDRKGAIRLA